MGAFVTKVLTAAIYHGQNITDGAKLVLLAPAHRTQRPVGSGTERGVVRQSEIVADFMQGNLQGPLDEQFVFAIGVYVFGTQFIGGYDGHIILRVFTTEYRIIKFVVIFCFQVRIRDTKCMSPILSVQDHGQKMRIDAVHCRGIVVRQFNGHDHAVKRFKDSIADCSQTAVSNVVSDPHNVEPRSVVQHAAPHIAAIQLIVIIPLHVSVAYRAEVQFPKRHFITPCTNYSIYHFTRQDHYTGST